MPVSRVCRSVHFQLCLIKVELRHCIERIVKLLHIAYPGLELKSPVGRAATTQSRLRQRLPAFRGDFMQRAHLLEIIRGWEGVKERTASLGARILRHVLQIFAPSAVPGPTEKMQCSPRQFLQRGEKIGFNPPGQ